MADPIRTADHAHAVACSAMRAVLRCVADIDRDGLWVDDGARDSAHWVQMRYGISNCEAHRWIRAGHALEGCRSSASARVRPARAGEGAGARPVRDRGDRGRPHQMGRHASRWARSVAAPTSRSDGPVRRCWRSSAPGSSRRGTRTTVGGSGWRRSSPPPTARSSSARSSDCCGPSPRCRTRRTRCSPQPGAPTRSWRWPRPRWRRTRAATARWSWSMPRWRR